MTRRQLLDRGYSPREIGLRLGSGRLHPVHRGVYAIGRPELTSLGRWMAAVLACPGAAVLSHSSAAALWDLSPQGPRIEVSLPRLSSARRSGLVIHRPVTLDDRDLTRRHGIPVTRAARTLIDIAPRLSTRRLEAVVNRADHLDLVDPERLREEVEGRRNSAGAAVLRALLDRDTFRPTDTELERMFLRVVRRAGLPLPETQVQLNRYRVDFHWPALRLVVETDSLRYHRTAATQRRDAIRDREHAAAGLVSLRFTYREVRDEPDVVAASLSEVIGRMDLDG